MTSSSSLTTPRTSCGHRGEVRMGREEAESLCCLLSVISSRFPTNKRNRCFFFIANRWLVLKPGFVCLFAFFLSACLRFRAAAPRGGGEAEWRQVPGAAALHHPAHRGAPTRQRTRADWTAGGPQLSTPPPGEGLAWLYILMLAFTARHTNQAQGFYLAIKSWTGKFNRMWPWVLRDN